VKTIALTQGYETVVDDIDYDRLAVYNWHAWVGVYGHVYACRRNGADSNHAMHYDILPRVPDLQIDHKDRDTLNNTRSNLRYATYSQNRANTVAHTRTAAGYRGVQHYTYFGGSKWRAQISNTRDGVKGMRSLGYFDTAEEAARAYDAAAIERYGEFARLNFPERSYVS
jgi:HNH endonuclease